MAEPKQCRQKMDRARGREFARLRVNVYGKNCLKQFNGHLHSPHRAKATVLMRGDNGKSEPRGATKRHKEKTASRPAAVACAHCAFNLKSGICVSSESCEASLPLRLGTASLYLPGFGKQLVRNLPFRRRSPTFQDSSCRLLHDEPLGALSPMDAAGNQQFRFEW